MEKYRERSKDLHRVLVYLVKAYDSVPRDVIWRSVEKDGIVLGHPLGVIDYILVEISRYIYIVQF